jgi:hypothetical protein
MIRAQRSSSPALALILAIAAASLLVGCRTSRVYTDHYEAPELDLGAYRTYAWAAEQSEIDQRRASAHFSQLDSTRIRAAVDQELKARNYRLVANPADAQLIVSYTVRAKDVPVPENTPNGDSVAHGFNGPVTGRQSPMMRYRVRLVGQVAILLESREGPQPVWAGLGTRVLSIHKSRVELIDEIVRQILEPVPNRS